MGKNVGVGQKRVTRERCVAMSFYSKYRQGAVYLYHKRLYCLYGLNSGHTEVLSGTTALHHSLDK